MDFAAVHESAFGTKRTLVATRPSVPFIEREEPTLCSDCGDKQHRCRAVAHKAPAGSSSLIDINFEPLLKANIGQSPM
jgi:hypothetical protein